MVSIETADASVFMNMSRSRFGLSPLTHFLLKLLLCFMPIFIFEFLMYEHIFFLLRFYFLTNLGCTLALMIELLSVYVAFCDLIGKKLSRSFLRVHHLMFELIFVTQVMITIVYWVILHKDNMIAKKDRGDFIIIMSMLHHAIPVV